MKKLIEFQEDKHREVLEAVNEFRAENGTTFSEAVRRLILLGKNGCSAPSPETTIYTTPDPKVDELEEKFSKLKDIVTAHIQRHHEEK